MYTLGRSVSVLLLLALLFAGCPPSANGPSVRTKKNVVVASTFTSGLGRAVVDSTGYATGTTRTMDLSSYDSVEVFWTAAFHPYPAHAGEAYSTGLFQVLTGTSSYLYFQTAPADSVTTYDVMITAQQMPGRQSVQLFVNAGSTNAGTKSKDTVSAFSVHGWKW